MANILSPFIVFPLLSTAKHLSPSPSYAKPMSKLFSNTKFLSCSKCVDPQSLFIFVPFGDVFIDITLAPKSLKIFSAILYVAP